MMTLSILVAKILALTYISAGIAALSGKITFSQMMEDFERSPGLTFITGFMTLIFGVILVTYHNIWVKNWTVLITLIGWISVLKGIRLIAFPQSNAYFKSWYKNSKVWGICMLFVGIVFGYFGFK
jgi:hypothetical protein